MKFSIGFGRVALVAAIAQLAVVQQGQASGFEKGIMWGGRSAGVAGIANPYIAGSQALYFNPAGLANDKAGQDVAFNLSLLSAKFKGPVSAAGIGNVTGAGPQETSKDSLLTPFGATYNYTMDDRLGFGVGYYVSGGANAKYENVNFQSLTSAVAGPVTVNTDLKVSEIALGAGYKITDDLKVGIAYRIAMAQAEFALANSTGSGYRTTSLTDLKATDYAGFKVGAQYRLMENTKIGFNYRSEVNFKADGTSTINTNAAAGTGRSAKVMTTLPMQAQLGVVHDYQTWRALAEYVWTQYSRVGDISIEDTGTGAVSNVTMNWKDEHQVRLGGEYLGMSWPVRFGYAWTSQVTNSDYARATFAPPASANTLTLGSGQIFQVMDNPLQFDFAGEYTFASGDGNATQLADTRTGKYEVTAMALHLGLTYAF